MSMEQKDLVLNELKGLENGIKEVLKKQNEEIKKFGGTSTQTAQNLDRLEKAHESMERELKDINKVLSKIEEIEAKASRPNFSRMEQKSFGAVVGNAPEVKEFLDNKLPSSRPIHLGTMRQYSNPNIEQKSIAGPDQLRNVMSLDLLQTIYYDPLRPNRVRDLFPVNPTRFSLIEFVRETVLDIQAGTVAETLVKPESNITFSDFQMPVRTIAHFMPVARQLLSDIRGLESYLNQRMMQGLKQVEDTQLLYGSGTGSDITGIFNVSGLQTYNWSSGEFGDTYIDAIRRAITKAQLAYYPVDGIVLHPTAWEKIELTKSTEGLYVWVNIATGAGPQLWKVPIVTTTAIDADQGLLGAFSLGAAIWDSEEANMRMSEHHADFFIRNMVALLIEERLALTVFRPKSFVNLSFDSAPTS